MSAHYHRKYRKVMKEVNGLLNFGSEQGVASDINIDSPCDTSDEEVDGLLDSHSEQGVASGCILDSQCDISDDQYPTEPVCEPHVANCETCVDPSLPTCTDNVDECSYDESEDFLPLSSTDDESLTDLSASHDNTLQEDLAEWVVKARLPRQTCNDLLAILRKHGCQLPQDCRTMLNTPRSVPFENKCGGSYIYFGLERKLQQAVEDDPSCCLLEIQINVDGLPLYKSSCSQFWPILCSVNKSMPFIVALFYGQSKPNPVTDFTKDFVEEVIRLQARGLSAFGKQWTILIHSFVCDAPARAFLKNIKAHNSLHGCERCAAKGVSIRGRTVYTSLECLDAEKRSGEKFAALGYFPSHQNGPSAISCITDDCISRFPLDYMHLVCLGTVRRMLNFWRKGDRIVRLGSRHLLEISEKLVTCRDFIPSEFVRRPRPVVDLDRWKATELRQFLLYTGPVVLKNVLSPDLYHHFLALSVSISILVTQDNEERANMLPYAAKLLKYFVSDCSRLYGETFLVYNIHSLLHLADDAKFFSTTLDDLSAFKFENYLHMLKKLIRSARNPVVQVAKRIEEQEACVKQGSSMTPEKKFKLAAQGRDSLIQLHNGKYAEVLSVENDKIHCAVFRSRSLKPFFSQPCSSDIIDIYFYNDQNKSTRHQEVVWADIKRKALKLPVADGFVLVPLRHQNEHILS
jgi:hypothetical protein